MAGNGYRERHLRALWCFLDLAARSSGRKRGHHLQLAERMVPSVHPCAVSHRESRDSGDRVHWAKHVSLRRIFRRPLLALPLPPPLLLHHHRAAVSQILRKTLTLALMQGPALHPLHLGLS